MSLCNVHVPPSCLSQAIPYQASTLLDFSSLPLQASHTTSRHSKSKTIISRAWRKNTRHSTKRGTANSSCRGTRGASGTTPGPKSTTSRPGRSDRERCGTNTSNKAPNKNSDQPHSNQTTSTDNHNRPKMAKLRLNTSTKLPRRIQRAKSLPKANHTRQKFATASKPTKASTIKKPRRQFIIPLALQQKRPNKPTHHNPHQNSTTTTNQTTTTSTKDYPECILVRHTYLHTHKHYTCIHVHVAHTHIHNIIYTHTYTHAHTHNLSPLRTTQSVY